MNQIILGQNEDGTFNVLIPAIAVFDETGNALTAYTKTIVDPKSFTDQITAFQGKLDGINNAIANINKNSADEITALQAQTPAIQTEMDTVRTTQAQFLALEK